VRSLNLAGQDDLTVGAYYRDGLYGNQRWMLRPYSQAGELMLATKRECPKVCV
jgi:hypothetical protein